MIRFVHGRRVGAGARTLYPGIRKMKGVPAQASLLAFPWKLLCIGGSLRASLFVQVFLAHASLQAFLRGVFRGQVSPRKLLCGSLLRRFLSASFCKQGNLLCAHVSCAENSIFCTSTGGCDPTQPHWTTISVLHNKFLVSGQIPLCKLPLHFAAYLFCAGKLVCAIVLLIKTLTWDDHGGKPQKMIFPTHWQKLPMVIWGPGILINPHVFFASHFYASSLFKLFVQVSLRRVFARVALCRTQLESSRRLRSGQVLLDEMDDTLDKALAKEHIGKRAVEIDHSKNDMDRIYVDTYNRIGCPDQNVPQSRLDSWQ